MSAELAAPSRWMRKLHAWPWLETAQTLARRFREDRLAITAASLTFTTLISLVPLVTVMLALFSAFPMFATMQELLQKYFLQTLLPDTARPLLGFITQFSNRASRLGVVGLVALVVSAIAMMLTIDRALNAVWRVKRPRPVSARVLLYWAAVTLGPLVVGVSLTATSYAVSASRGLIGEMPRGFGALVGTMEFLIEALGVAALFHYVPNTRVRWRHALIGGLFVAVCLTGGKRALSYYLGAVPTYSVIYGAFATVPIFLVWIFLGWVIVLFGAVIAAYAPLLGRKMRRWSEAPGAAFHLALVLLGQLAAARDRGQGGMSADGLARELGIDPLQTESTLEALVDLDWVGRLSAARSPRYVLLCDLAATSAEPLVSRLLLDPAPDLGPVWAHAGFERMTLADIVPAPQ